MMFLRTQTQHVKILYSKNSMQK